MDSRRDQQPENDGPDGPAMPSRAELEAMFDADEADVEAGRTVPAQPVLAEMRATAAHIRRERAAKKATASRRA